jgi:hypothetical protein
VEKLYAGDPSGWYVLDVKNRRVFGPFSPLNIRTNATWAKVITRDVGDVYSGKK